MMDRGMLTIFLLGLVALVYGQQLDPIVNFCRRINHQTMISNNTLYIDGGSAMYIDVNGTRQVGNITEGVNKYLITVDMSSSWDTTSNISMAAIDKGNATNTKRPAPQNVRGALFHGPLNDTKMYQFGGSTSYENVSFPGWQIPKSDQYPLYSYDGGKNEWIAIDLTNQGIIRPSSGASAEAPDQGLGFYFNGQLDSGSSTQSQNLGDYMIKFMKGMILLDFYTGEVRNMSTDQVSDLPRVRAEMVYVPDIGKKGVLVLIGGGEKPLPGNADWLGTPLGMDEIDVFDIASLDDPKTPNGTWYKQKVGGLVPQSRLDHCIVLASSQDGSSHNIYMYGGRDPYGTYFDEVYVLSLPSFTWINLYSGNGPRYGMTCHMVGNRQMLTIGGASEVRINVDCDPEVQGLAVFDMVALNWGTTYIKDAPPYEVPGRIRDAIGGQATGNATLKQPIDGWSSPGLANVFLGLSGSGNSSTPTNSASADATATNAPSSSNTGAIAGGVVGGVAGIALIGLGVFLLRRRHNKQKLVNAPLYEVGGQPLVEKDGHGPKSNNEMLADTHYQPPVPLSEMPGEIPAHELHELNPANYSRDRK